MAEVSSPKNAKPKDSLRKSASDTELIKLKPMDSLPSPVESPRRRESRTGHKRTTKSNPPRSKGLGDSSESSKDGSRKPKSTTPRAPRIRLPTDLSNSPNPSPRREKKDPENSENLEKSDRGDRSQPVTPRSRGEPKNKHELDLTGSLSDTTQPDRPFRSPSSSSVLKPKAPAERDKATNLSAFPPSQSNHHLSTLSPRNKKHDVFRASDLSPRYLQKSDLSPRAPISLVSPRGSLSATSSPVSPRLVQSDLPGRSSYTGSTVGVRGSVDLSPTPENRNRPDLARIPSGMLNGLLSGSAFQTMTNAVPDIEVELLALRQDHIFTFLDKQKDVKIISSGTIEKIVWKLLEWLVTDPERKAIFKLVSVFILCTPRHITTLDLLRILDSFWNTEDQTTPLRAGHFTILSSLVRS